MKKLLILSALFLFAKGGLFAQDENNLKNFRFGLKATPTFNWLRPDDKKLEKDGTLAGIKYGLITEFRLNAVASFSTGIEGSHVGGRVNYTDSAYYFVHDDAYMAKEDTAGHSNDLAVYRLTNREFRITYVTVPVTLKLKTKDIGGMTYFGMFGGDLNFRAGAKATDKNVSSFVPPNTTFDPTKVDITKDVNLFTVNLNVGAGMEYNLSGTTSFVASLNYNRGFMSALKADSEYLMNPDVDATPYRQKAYLDGIVVTVGVMF